MSSTTKALFESRQQMKDENKFEEVKQLTKKIRKSIQKDRTEYKLANLEQELWQDIQRAKANYLPKYTKIKQDGEVVKSNINADVIADYFEHKQWGSPEESAEANPWPNQVLFDMCSNIEVGNITLTELRDVLNRCKNNKSPGSDGIPVEFFKWLTDEA